jgi:hypothetical protein
MRARRLQFFLRLLDAAASLFHRPLRRGDVARCRGRHDRHAAARGDGRRFRIGELGSRLGDRDLVVARVQLHQHRAGIDLLIVADRHPQHAPRDAGSNRHDMRFHLRIVGRFPSGGQPQPRTHADQDHDDQAGDGPETALTEDRCWLVGHQRTPPKS